MVETMEKTGSGEIRVVHINTVVVGTGAAGFNAAERLFRLGQHDVAIVTEGVNAGTSRNTGSDKQTYYKLTLSGGDPDSVREMAQTLFAGECVDGDIALCEAALSTQSFLRLTELGVPFPRNRYGEYVGYKTDHDPRQRATSVGPYTSKWMTECLEKAVKEDGILIFDHMQVIKILSDGVRAYGLLCLDLEKADNERERFVAFRTQNIIYATGGPAGIYADSVYPLSQYGASGLAFEAGAAGKNLTEWQYGLASISPRWNVSGTYMQVLPKFVSTEEDGSDPREFLFDFFTDTAELLSKVFLKGYQWPFDVRKIDGGSSIIDVLVYLESCKGRRVFLDFRENPADQPIDFSALSEEARDYLEKAGACFGTPIERLAHMNQPAIDFYMDKGVDLYQEPLEVALCAQHNNGGLSIDCWWQTNVQGLFAAGEVSASHGVYRPGGSALNAGQVGSTRAAQYIAARCREDTGRDGFDRLLPQAVAWAEQVLKDCRAGQSNVAQKRRAATVAMSRIGAAIRNRQQLQAALDEVGGLCRAFTQDVRFADWRELSDVFRLRDTLLCQKVYLAAMLDYIDHGGSSRGSALYTDPEGHKPYACLPDIFTYRLDNGRQKDRIQETFYRDGKCSFQWRSVRPIPESDDFFENVWRSFRESGNIV